uniref:Uncharacterized protein n=1 Tax=Anopheles farauti TaxID=69004 RepID=A0A182Q4Z9_9DIPT
MHLQPTPSPPPPPSPPSACRGCARLARQFVVQAREIGERVVCVGKRPVGPGFRHQKGFGSRRSYSAVVPGAASVNMCNRMCAYVQRLALLGFCIVAFSVFWWCFFCSIYVVMFGDALTATTGTTDHRCAQDTAARVGIMATTSSDDGHFGTAWA